MLRQFSLCVLGVFLIAAQVPAIAAPACRDVFMMPEHSPYFLSFLKFDPVLSTGLLSPPAIHKGLVQATTMRPIIDQAVVDAIAVESYQGEESPTNPHRILNYQRKSLSRFKELYRDDPVDDDLGAIEDAVEKHLSYSRQETLTVYKENGATLAHMRNFDASTGIDESPESPTERVLHVLGYDVQSMAADRAAGRRVVLMGKFWIDVDSTPHEALRAKMLLMQGLIRVYELANMKARMATRQEPVFYAHVTTLKHARLYAADFDLQEVERHVDAKGRLHLLLRVEGRAMIQRLWQREKLIYQQLENLEHAEATSP